MFTVRYPLPPSVLVPPSTLKYANRSLHTSRRISTKYTNTDDDDGGSHLPPQAALCFSGLCGVTSCLDSTSLSIAPQQSRANPIAVSHVSGCRFIFFLLAFFSSLAFFVSFISHNIRPNKKPRQHLNLSHIIYSTRQTGGMYLRKHGPILTDFLLSYINRRKGAHKHTHTTVASTHTHTAHVSSASLLPIRYRSLCCVVLYT